MKYFCNTCGNIQDTDKPNHTHGADEDGNCNCGADDWLEVGDPVKDSKGFIGIVSSIEEYKGDTWLEVGKKTFKHCEITYS